MWRQLLQFFLLLRLATFVFFQTHSTALTFSGLVSWILAFVSVVLGLFSWHAQSLKNFARPVIFKFVHNFIGIACYAIGIASLCLGFYIGAFSRLVTENQLLATVGLVGIITCWSSLAAFKSGFNQIKTMFSQSRVGNLWARMVVFAFMLHMPVLTI